MDSSRRDYRVFLLYSTVIPTPTKADTTCYLLSTYVPKICFSRDGAYELCMFLSGCLGSETCDNGQTASVAYRTVRR